MLKVQMGVDERGVKAYGSEVPADGEVDQRGLVLPDQRGKVAVGGGEAGADVNGLLEAEHRLERPCLLLEHGTERIERQVVGRLEAHCRPVALHRCSLVTECVEAAAELVP